MSTETAIPPRFPRFPPPCRSGFQGLVGLIDRIASVPARPVGLFAHRVGLFDRMACQFARAVGLLVLTASLPALVTGPAQGQEPALASASDLDHFLGWFAGEYNNNEQVWQQAVDGVAPDARHEHIHHVFLPVSTPAIGDHAFFVKQYLDGDYENVYRQRLYSFSVDRQRDAIVLAIHRFLDEARYRYADRDPSVLEEIGPDDLRHLPGCNVFWRFVGDHYVGEMDDGACFYFSNDLGRNIYITDTLRLDADEIRIADAAYDEDGNRLFGRDEPHVNRKVKYFDGWAAIRRDAFDPAAAQPDEMLLVPGLRLHNEGQVVPMVTESGDDTGYALELARLTYQNTQVAVLKLGILEAATGETVAYSWADPEAVRIGINLGWMQAGLTREGLVP